MEDEGASNVFRKAIPSLFGVTTVVILFLVLFSAVLYVKDPDAWKSKYIVKEMSYVATMVSGTDMKVEVNYEKTELKDTGGIITASYDNTEHYATDTYYGEPVTIKAGNTNGVYIITS